MFLFINSHLYKEIYIFRSNNIYRQIFHFRRYFINRKKVKEFSDSFICLFFRSLSDEKFNCSRFKVFYIFFQKVVPYNEPSSSDSIKSAILYDLDPVTNIVRISGFFISVLPVSFLMLSGTGSEIRSLTIFPLLLADPEK